MRTAECQCGSRAHSRHTFSSPRAERPRPLARFPAIHIRSLTPALTIVFGLALLTACGQESEPVAGIRDVADPAMNPEEQQRANAAAIDRTSDHPDAEKAAAAVPNGAVVDLAGERVFLPGRGWFDAEEFLRIYDERPEILPDDLDLYAVHRLREMQREE